MGVNRTRPYLHPFATHHASPTVHKSTIIYYFQAKLYGDVWYYVNKEKYAFQMMTLQSKLTWR